MPPFVRDANRRRTEVELVLGCEDYIRPGCKQEFTPCFGSKKQMKCAEKRPVCLLSIRDRALGVVP